MDELSDESVDHRQEVVKFLTGLDEDDSVQPANITPAPHSHTFATNDQRILKTKKVREINRITKISAVPGLHKLAIHNVKQAT